jgi:hypothetical protein
MLAQSVTNAVAEYNVKLFTYWIKYTSAISGVKQLNGEQANISGAISAVVIRELTTCEICFCRDVPVHYMMCLYTISDRHSTKKTDLTGSLFPDDEGGNGFEKVGLFTIKLFNMADSPRTFYPV